MKKRVFSAVRPSGELQLGNYLGAISQWVEMQDEYDCVFAIADYHAITTEYDPKTFQQKVKDHMLFYLASGIDPQKCTLFIQSQNSNHTELAWLLGGVATVSELGRMTQFKDKTKSERDIAKKSIEKVIREIIPDYEKKTGDKIDKKLEEMLIEKTSQKLKNVIIEAANTKITSGLFNYPVLMAADILLYQTELVPVGEDQVQHVEIAADIAKRFNNRFGEAFKIPQAKILKKTARIMSLTDPKNKMSKSGEDKARINLSDADDVIMKKIMSAVTDSGKEIEYTEDKPAISNLLRIYSACSNELIEEIVAKFKGKGYADFKNSLAEVIIKKIGPIRDKKMELEKDEELYKKIIFEGLEKAEIISRETLESAKKAAGLL